MKNFPRFFLMLLVLLTGVVLAEVRAEEASGPEQFRNELEEIKTHLANIEQQQKDNAAKDDLILEKLDQLRVWVHRK